MYMSFGRKLKGLGRIHLGFRVRWWNLLFVAMYVMFYYIVIGCIWCIYGACWLMYQMIRLPVLGIVKLVKNLAGKQSR